MRCARNGSLCERATLPAHTATMSVGLVTQALRSACQAAAR